MFSDKTSFILAISVSLTFSIAGMLDILDNLVVASVIIIAFMLVVINLFIRDKAPIKAAPKKEDIIKKNVDES
ncbi:hypothetical protein ACFFVB_06010 [Formosa undariae]|uniref:Uncharacterized protein n=1 Tax=Formosa undariae TaxID=1325436 RepID=A0ABV5EZL0_9FLAO